MRIALHTRVRASHDYSPAGPRRAAGRLGAMTAMRIVDAHHHLWDLGVRDQDWITGPVLAPLRRDFLLGDYQPVAQAHGVAASVVVQTVTVPGRPPNCSRWPAPAT